MTTTELIKLLKSIEKSVSGRSREINFRINNEVFFSPDVKISGTGDGCAGADVKCFIELKELFNKEGYTETDLLELKRYHALCLIRNEDNVYSAFVVKLPK
ncbi:MAG: hypothetical protein [Bacteriophage sp.]|nr:MAG: hypothetical protein [Bacteriophage sp.]